MKALPARHSRCSPLTASAGPVPTMNCSATRVMFRRAMVAAAALPNGTWSATSRPRSSTLGTSAPSKYSSR